MHLIGSTILAWLNLAAWVVVYCIFAANWRTLVADTIGADAWEMGFALAFALWLACCLAVAIQRSARCGKLLRCRRDPEFVAGLTLDLNSDDPRQQRLALQTLADYCAQPFGRREAWQFETMRRLVGKRAQAEAMATEAATLEPEESERQTPESGPVLEPLQRGVAETLQRLGDAIKDTVLDWNPDAEETEFIEEGLPPLQTHQFAEAMREYTDTAVTALAEAINEAPDAIAILTGPPRCELILGGYLDAALRIGLKLREDAALVCLAVPQGSSARPVRKKHPAARRPIPEPKCDWVKKFRRMKADEGNLCG